MVAPKVLTRTARPVAKVVSPPLEPPATTTAPVCMSKETARLRSRPPKSSGASRETPPNAASAASSPSAKHPTAARPPASMAVPVKIGRPRTTWLRRKDSEGVAESLVVKSTAAPATRAWAARRAGAGANQTQARRNVGAG